MPLPRTTLAAAVSTLLLVGVVAAPQALAEDDVTTSPTASTETSEPPGPTASSASAPTSTSTSPSPAGSPSPTASPAPSGTPAPSPTPRPGQGVVGVDTSDPTIGRFRYRGVSVYGYDLPDGTVTVHLDGEVIRTLRTDGGELEFRQLFPRITLGEHTLTVTHEGEIVAESSFEVVTDNISMTLDRHWITPEKLATDGVTVEVEEIEPGYFVTATFGDSSQVKRARADENGDVSFTFTPADQRPGEIVVHAQVDRIPPYYAYEAVQVTRLSVVAASDGTTIVGEGFEPGSTVTLEVDGINGSATASPDGQAILAAPVSGRHDVVLRSDAGEVRGTLDLATDAAVDQAVETIEELRTTTAQVKDLQAASATTSALLAQQTKPGVMSTALSSSIQQQVSLREKVFGDVVGAQKYSVVAGQSFPNIGDLAASAGQQQSGDTRMQADAKRAEAQADVDAAAAQLASASDLANEMQSALDEMLRAIIQYLKELNDAKVEQMRAITRESTPYLVSSSVDPAEATVRIPAGFTGRHHLGFIEPTSGILVARVPFDVVPAGTSTGSGPAGALPDTGGLSPWWAATGLALLAAGSLVVRRRPGGHTA